MAKERPLFPEMPPKSQSQGSILGFFNGTAPKAKRAVAACPVCGVTVQVDRINAHMDSDVCRPAQGNGKRQASESDSFKNKRQKTDHDEQKKEAEADLVEAKDEALIADLLEDVDEWTDEDEAVISPSQKILLSPSISYNPARYPTSPVP
jgi:hypothetical protein